MIHQQSRCTGDSVYFHIPFIQYQPDGVGGDRDVGAGYFIVVIQCYGEDRNDHHTDLNIADSIKFLDGISDKFWEKFLCTSF